MSSRADDRPIYRPMRSNRERAGLGIATLGAAAMLASLWQPWYRFQLPSDLVERVNQFAGQFGNFGALIRQGAASLEQHGPFHLSGWLVFRGFDVMLCLLAVFGLILGLQALATSGRIVLVPEGKAFAVLGAVAAALTVYHMVHVPLPGGVLAVDRGAWIALVGAGAMIAGGVASAIPSGRAAVSEIRWDAPSPADAAPADAAAWSTSGSIAPPA
jgi:hypothetical protein